MPNLNQIGDAAAPPRVDLIRARQRPDAAPEQTESAQADRGDQVQLSNLARSLQDPEIRTDLVQRVRAEIASGKYETPERIDQAVEALARELEA